MSRTSNFYSRRHDKSTYRSGLEEQTAKHLKAAFPSRPVLYEQYDLEYTVPARKTHYTPDFILPNGIIIETKGRFIAEDRQKHLLIKAQHPDLDIRFVFTNPNQRLYKGSPTSYAMWCGRHGFLYAAKTVPAEWLNEPETDRRRKANGILRPKRRADIEAK